MGLSFTVKLLPASRFSVLGLGATLVTDSSSPPDGTHQRMAFSAADSSGSPAVSPSMHSSELHPARTRPAASATLVMGVSSSLPPAPLRPPTPTATSSSVVSVPVLSKRQASILPAMGTRNGSVQNTCIFIRVIRLLFTASAVCIGSSGGITDVTMRMQCRSSSYLRGGEQGEHGEHGEQKRR